MKIIEQNYSFKKGFSHVSQKDAKRVKDELMRSLNINSRSQWYVRMYGKVIPNMEEMKAIESILMKYGVKKSEIWGR